jgi:hypothetical protein
MCPEINTIDFDTEVINYQEVPEIDDDPKV